MIGTFNHFVRQTFVRYYEPRGLPQTSGPDRWSSLWFRLLSYSFVCSGTNYQLPQPDRNNGHERSKSVYFESQLYLSL